jgi:hypothetical protein
MKELKATAVVLAVAGTLGFGYGAAESPFADAIALAP